MRSLVACSDEGVIVCHRGQYGRTGWLESETTKFVFIASGSYGVTVDAHDMHVAPGQFIILNPHSRHRHLRLRGVKFLVEVSAEVMAMAAASTGHRLPPRFRQLPGSDSLISRWVRTWITAAEAETPSVDDIIPGLAIRLIELQCGPPRLRTRAAVGKALALIDEHFVDRLTVDVLAGEAGMERFAFAHAFRRETGLPPHAYLRQRRLIAAAAALESSSAPVIDIALRTGFGSVSSFNRSFRAGFGVTPSRYRELAGAQGFTRNADARTSVAPGRRAFQAQGDRPRT